MRVWTLKINGEAMDRGGHEMDGKKTLRQTSRARRVRDQGNDRRQEHCVLVRATDGRRGQLVERKDGGTGHDIGSDADRVGHGQRLLSGKKRHGTEIVDARDV